MYMMDKAVQAIAEPRRRDILYLVRDRELASSVIASHFDISAPAVSQHLKVLEESGLVVVRREGPKRYYRLRREGKNMIQINGEKIVKEIFIECRPETLFSFFTDPDKMMRWMGRHVLLEPSIGGKYRIDIIRYVIQLWHHHKFRDCHWDFQE